ncbi:hypothetical protein Mucpa_6480 [Mucilaginibacter paludis DSM 18603]|uniref:Uncharacterized protein n=1 Tax=Mucilaginibacter paludis DSM 18603 TaxID=714943 RepID=H1Y9N1_9SPHI|nr:hypothetical protein Mucpa_6480 [Mucilaginibacter paludis DSM 18603]
MPGFVVYSWGNYKIPVKLRSKIINVQSKTNFTPDYRLSTLNLLVF